MDKFKCRRRGYADFFKFDNKNKDIEEIGIAKQLAESAFEIGLYLYNNIKVCGYKNHAPDCEAIDMDGKRIAIELTELVCEEVIIWRKSLSGRNQYCDWDQHLFDKKMRHLLNKKDNVTLKDDPFPGGYYVIIFTDELDLWPEKVRDFVIDTSYQVSNIMKAWLIFSYNPNYNPSYYFIEIPLKKVGS